MNDWYWQGVTSVGDHFDGAKTTWTVIKAAEPV